MSLEDRVHGTKPYCCVNVIKTDDGNVYMRDYKKKKLYYLYEYGTSNVFQKAGLERIL